MEVDTKSYHDKQAGKDKSQMQEKIGSENALEVSRDPNAHFKVQLPVR